MGNYPSLDRFKMNNGFTQFPITRYYIALTKTGKFATALNLHREIKGVLPPTIKYQLIPVYNWLSRTKAKARLYLKTKRLH